MCEMLYIETEFTPFMSGKICAKPQPHGDGFIMPLGWEDELTSRGIVFETIEIED